MQVGSDAARNIAKLVLLDSNFQSMPKIVAEGRRTINNIERSASLFLSKTIYASILAIIFVFAHMPYPFMPIQLSLIALVCIGIPSFILALEPNKERVKGRFIQNVISKSLPTALTTVVNIIIVAIISWYAGIPKEIYSTICVVLISMIALFMACFVILKDWFSVVITKQYIELVALLGAIAVANFILFNYATEKILRKNMK